MRSRTIIAPFDTKSQADEAGEAIKALGHELEVFTAQDRDVFHAHVRFDPDRIDPDDLFDQICALGYQTSLLGSGKRPCNTNT